MCIPRPLVVSFNCTLKKRSGRLLVPKNWKKSTFSKMFGGPRGPSRGVPGGPRRPPGAENTPQMSKILDFLSEIFDFFAIFGGPRGPSRGAPGTLRGPPGAPPGPPRGRKKAFFLEFYNSPISIPINHPKGGPLYTPLHPSKIHPATPPARPGDT